MLAIWAGNRLHIGKVRLSSWQRQHWRWPYSNPFLHASAVCFLVLIHQTAMRDLGLNWGHWTTGSASVIFGTAVLFGGVVVATNSSTQKKLQVHFPGWSTILFQGLWVPVAEELFWRGYFQAQVGLWLTALVFGIVHASNPGTLASRVGGALYAGVLGLSFGYLRWSSGGIIAIILLHSFLNVLNHVTDKNSKLAPTRYSTPNAVP